MKKKFRITCTHNPQDFFNGQEPAELSKTYISIGVQGVQTRLKRNVRFESK